MKVMVKKQGKTLWLVKCNDVIVYRAYDWKIALEYAIDHSQWCMLQNPTHRKGWH